MKEKIQEGSTFSTTIDGITYECYFYFESYWGHFGSSINLHIAKTTPAKFLWWNYNKLEWDYTHILGFTDDKYDKPKYHFVGEIRFFKIEDAKVYVKNALWHRTCKLEREVREQEELNSTKHKTHI